MTGYRNTNPDPVREHGRSEVRETPAMDIATALALAVDLCRYLPRGEAPATGDLVAEVTGMGRPDPDAIGWLIGHDRAPYKADDPLGGSVPMREVWDIRPLNPEARLQVIGGEPLQRWENAEFVKVPDGVVRRLGLTAP